MYIYVVLLYISVQLWTGYGSYLSWIAISNKCVLMIEPTASLNTADIKTWESNPKFVIVPKYLELIPITCI